MDDRSADESHINLRGERDVIGLRNPTEDKQGLSTDANKCWPECKATSMAAKSDKEKISSLAQTENPNAFRVQTTECSEQDDLFSPLSGLN